MKMEKSHQPIKISFVIPVYNVERYLKDCLNSVVCQLEGNELILVDDGSTDLSGRFCDEYASQYPLIKVLHTENKGASHARNLGVDNAQGDYIVFMDSDDYINQNFVQNFEHANITADVIFYPMEKLLMNGQCIPMRDGIGVENTRNLKPSEVLSHIASCPQFPASPCGKIVRRTFMREHHIHYTFDRVSEDYDWTYQLLQHAQRFDFFSGGLYTYRQIPQSRSSMGRPKSVEDQLVILESWMQRDVPKSFRQHLNSFLAYEYAMILPFYGALSKKEKETYRYEIHHCAYLLRYGKSRKLKLIRLVVVLLGIELTAKILYEYISFRNKRYGKS